MTGLTLVDVGLLLGGGVVAGWMNTVAGAGSVVALPALLASGLSPHDANGTLRVAILAQSALAARGLARGEAKVSTAAAPLLACVVVGALVGSLIATWMPAAALRWVLAATMLIVAAGLLWPPAPTRRPSPARPDAETSPSPTAATALGDAPAFPRIRVGPGVGLFLAGLHGGLAQAGVGLVLVLVLVRGLGLTVGAANAMKSVATLALSTLVLPVFLLADAVRWAPALVLAAGALVGAALGVRTARRSAGGALRGVMVAVALAAAVVVVVR